MYNIYSFNISFNDIIGNNNILKKNKNSNETNNLTHIQMLSPEPAPSVSIPLLAPPPTLAPETKPAESIASIPAEKKPAEKKPAVSIPVSALAPAIEQSPALEPIASIPTPVSIPLPVLIPLQAPPTLTPTHTLTLAETIALPPLQILEPEPTPEPIHTVIGPYRGGSDNDISTQLNTLYSLSYLNEKHKKVPWIANTFNTDNEFFYIKNNKTQIIGAVRISNTLTKNEPLELGMDFIMPDYQKTGLYDILLIARLKYIMDTKMSMYVLYTEHDNLRDKHIKYKMTLSPLEKIKVDSTFYWRLEYNRPFASLYVNFTKGGQGLGKCNGMAISNDINNQYIYTANHCVISSANQTEIQIALNLINYPHIDKTAYDENTKTEIVMTNTHIDTKKIENKKYEWTNPFDDITDLEETNDVIILKTNVFMDTSNIYFLNNVNELPANTNLIPMIDYYLKDINGIKNYISKQPPHELLLDTYENETQIFKVQDSTNKYVYFGDSKILKSHNINEDTYKSFFRKISETSFAKVIFGDHGHSGSALGICFGLNKKKFAIVGNIASNNYYIPSASRKIEQLRRININVNIAHYNTVDKTISEVLNTP